MFEIVRYTAGHADEWDRFVGESKNGTFLFFRQYMDYHSDRFRDHSLLFYLERRLLAVLPANERYGVLYSHQGLTYGSLLMSRQLTVAQTVNCFAS